MSEYFPSVLAVPLSRRSLIKGFAAAGAAAWASTLPGAARAAPGPGGAFTNFHAIAPSAADELQVPEGYVADVLIRWGDEFAPGLKFGYNCDYSAYFPLKGSSPNRGLIWVNHEYITPFFTSDWRNADDPTWDPRVEPYKTIMANEKKEVGGSIIEVRRDTKGAWHVVEGSPYSKRFYGDGPLVPYDGPVANSGLVPTEGVLGTLANCSGGHTPWGTVLSAEENYQSYGLKRSMPFALGWIRNPGGPGEDVNYYVGEDGTNQDDGTILPPILDDPDRFSKERERPYYGYICEVDPYTGQAVKHTAMGRIHHENVAMRIATDGRVVAYTGDDAPRADGMFYKFVSKNRYRPGMSRANAMTLLSDGQLYVAQFKPHATDAHEGDGVWHPLDMTDPEALAFTTAWIEKNIVPGSGGGVGEFRVPRAEDCEIVPNRPRDVLVALTSSPGLPVNHHLHGVVRLIREESESPDSFTFEWSNVLQGGEQSGFASPDNLGFSGPQELWVVTDISTSSLNHPTRGFAWHMNNAMFYVPLEGPNAHVAFRFANAPVQAELTGPTFVKAAKTLFLNVQHPGENTNANSAIGDTSAYTSWWPDGNRTAGTGTAGKPKSSLVAIRKL